jgi:hypothetical protein
MSATALWNVSREISWSVSERFLMSSCITLVRTSPSDRTC